MSEKPVAHVIVSGDLVGVTADQSQLAELRKMNNAPLYAQSPAEARALAIAECARVAMSLYNGSDHLPSYDEGWNDGIDAAEQAIRALSSPPSVTEEWIEKVVSSITVYGTFERRAEFAAVRATLAALGVKVEGAGK